MNFVLTFSICVIIYCQIHITEFYFTDALLGLDTTRVIAFPFLLK